MTIILNGTAGITFPNGQLQNAGLPDPGASGNILVSDGTDWNSAAPSPNNALSQSIPLKSGATLAAGRALNINSSGEVGDFPVVNTQGTLVENTTTTYFGSGGVGFLSTDGSRVLIPVNASTTSATFQVRGVALTSTTQTTGSAVSLSASGSSTGTMRCKPINETQFLITYYTYSGTTSYYCQPYGYARVVEVDASGNVTLGTANTWTTGNSNDNLDFGVGINVSQLPSGRFSVYSYFPSNAGVPAFYSRTFSVSGTTLTSTSDSDLSWFSNYPSFLTSGNKLMGVSSNTFFYCDYDGTTTSNYANSSPTSSPRGSTVYAGILLSASYGLVAYNKLNNDFVLETFSINQTTGVPTSTATYVIVPATTDAATDITFAILSSTAIIINYKIGTSSYALSLELDATAQVTGTGIPLITNSSGDAVLDIVKTGTNAVRYVYNNSSKGYSRDITINSYDTLAWVSLGASATSQTTSPATVIVGGICSGFTSLTPGVAYYVDETTYDGQITASQGNYLVGTAVSSTQILLG